jgi:hypothetical protein
MELRWRGFSHPTVRLWAFNEPEAVRAILAPGAHQEPGPCPCSLGAELADLDATQHFVAGRTGTDNLDNESHFATLDAFALGELRTLKRVRAEVLRILSALKWRLNRGE